MSALCPYGAWRNISGDIKIGVPMNVRAATLSSCSSRHAEVAERDARRPGADAGEMVAAQEHVPRLEVAVQGVRL